MKNLFFYSKILTTNHTNQYEQQRNVYKKFVRFVVNFLFLCVCTGLFAQTADEIETLLNTSAVTWSQAARFTLEASDTAAIKNPAEAFRYAQEKNLLPKNAQPDTEATLEGVSLVLMKAFNIKGGLFYSLGKTPHYAYRELVYKEIIQDRADPNMKVSGDQLLFMAGRILSLREQEEAAGKRASAKQSAAENSRKETVAAAINAALEEQKVQDTSASVTEEGISINLSNIQFLADSAVLPESEKKKLRDIAVILKAVSAKKVMVAGHSAMAGSEEGRRRLSYERAVEVASYLGSLEACRGIVIAPVGYGADRPLADNATTTGMAANRRVEIIILESAQ